MQSRYIWRAFILVIFFVSLLFVGKVFAQYNNLNTILGQFDSLGDPVNTTSYPDGVQPTNAYNFDAVQGSILFDETRHRLYVSDTVNNRILVYETDTANNIPYGEAPDYVLGQSAFTTNTAATSQSGLSSPRGLALDESNGRLFVADANNCRVMVFDVSGAISNNMNAANYLGGGATFSSLTCATTSYETGNLNRFYAPSGLAYDTDTSYLYVSDQSKKRITIFDVAAITNGETALSVVLGDSTGNFSHSLLRGMSIDTANNRLFVGDVLKNRVLVYDIAALVSLEDPVNVLGQPDFATTTAGVTQSKMFGANMPAYRASDNKLAVALSGGRVLIYDVATISNGENAINVLGQADFVTANDTVISLAYTGNVYSTEWVGSNKLLALDVNRMLEFDVTSIVNGESATNVLGQVDPFGVIRTDTRTADGIFNTAYGIDQATDVKVDTVNNRLYVADYDNKRVLVYNLDSTTKAPLDNEADYVLGQSSFTSETEPSANDSSFWPHSIDIDESGNRLFVSDINSSRVLVFDVSTITNGESAVYVLGQSTFSGNATGTTDSSFNVPRYVHYNSDNQWLFVGDAYNYRVLLFDLSQGITNGMAASKVIGQPDFVTAVCNTTIDGMCDAVGQIFYQASRRQLYLADSYNYRVLVYTLPATLAEMSNGMSASYVIGQADFTATDTTPVTTRMDTPYGLVMTDSQMLLVQDCYHYRVLAYDLSAVTTDPEPIGVVGQSDFSTVSPQSVSATSMDCGGNGQGIDFDNTGKRLYIADGAFNRVMIQDFAKIGTATLENGTVNSSYSQTISSAQLYGTALFTLMSGSLPTGVSLTSGVISGIPTLAGTYNFTLRLTDDGGGIGSFFTTKGFSIQISAQSSGSSSSSSSSSSSTSTSSTTTSASPSPTSFAASTFEDLASPLPSPSVEPIPTPEALPTAEVPEELVRIADQVNAFVAAAVQAAGEVFGPLAAVLVQGLAPVVALVAAASKDMLKEVEPVAPIVPAAVTVVATTATAGLLISELGLAFLDPEFLYKLGRSFFSLFQAPPQGVVFDSTFTPIPFAKVEVTDAKHTHTDTAYTDVYGAYRGLHIPAGSYKIRVTHPKYDFHEGSSALPTAASRLFYKGEFFALGSEDKNPQLYFIPMATVSDRHLFSLRVMISKIIRWLILHEDEIITALCVVSIIMTLSVTTVLNFMISAFYGYLVVKKLIHSFKKPLVQGKVLGPDGKPLQDAIVRFTDVEYGETQAVVETDEKGRYKAFINPGKYHVVASGLGYLADEGAARRQVDLHKRTKMDLQLRDDTALKPFFYQLLYAFWK